MRRGRKRGYDFFFFFFFANFFFFALSTVKFDRYQKKKGDLKKFVSTLLFLFLFLLLCLFCIVFHCSTL